MSISYPPGASVVHLAAIPVEKRSPLPAWAQVDRDLRRLIERDLQVGTQLPNERELSVLYGVSRITIRQALAGLELDGYVERRQGAGTFVSDRPKVVQHDFGLTTPWKERFAAGGHTAASVALREDDEPQPWELVRLLPDSSRCAPVRHFKRAHQVDGRPIGITDSWINLDRVPDIAGTELVDGSMSKTLATQFGITNVTWDHFLEVGVATQEDAAELRTTVGAPVILVWSASHSPDGALVETSRTLWLASRVRFHYSSGGSFPQDPTLTP